MANECNIRVMCRFRPLNENEKRSNSNVIAKFPSDDTEENTVIFAGKPYIYDKVFRPDTTQENVYNACAKEIVGDVLNGYNGTIFAYGQTSSGKTHTMEGLINSETLQGIIPRIVQDIFNHIYAMSESIIFHINVSYFEIYLDKIRDLLDLSKTNLSVHEDKNRVPYVKGATQRFVTTPEEVFDAIEDGKSNRHIAVTNMNEHSSRSHCVFLISITQENQEAEKKLTGKLYLVDLAGSEKVSKTGAEGSVLEEAKNINKSLSALANVISALADAKPYVPYRDSKLTRILQESLGGNARTTIIICCSPASFNESETKSTLYFGQRAKTVKNVVVVNEELSAEQWKRRYEKEHERVARLKGQLARAQNELERWRRGEQVSVDEQVNLKIDLLDNEPGGLSSSASLLSLSSIPISLSSNALLNQTVTLSANVADATYAVSVPSDWEKERMVLYAQLDEKDDELNNASQTIETLKMNLAEQDELIKQLRKENDDLQNRIGALETDNEMRKDELKEIMKAFEELAMNFDLKQQESDTTRGENETLLQELDKKAVSLKQIENELDLYKDNMNSQRKRIFDMMFTLLKDLSEISSIVGGGTVTDFKRASLENIDNAEEEFTMARLFVGKLKAEIKVLTQKCLSLDQEKLGIDKTYEQKVKELDECRLVMVQTDAKIKSQQEYIKDLEMKKRRLEDELDASNEEIARIKANEAVSNKTNVEVGSAEDMVSKAFKEQLESHVEQLKKQVKELRDENDKQQKKTHELIDENQSTKIAYEKLQNDFIQMKKDETETSAKLKDLALQQASREQAKQDLKSLEETVAKELQSLHNLRKLFVQDLQARLKKSQKLPENDEDELTGNVAQKQKIAFLENNLEQLTKVHKQLVRDNADLRCELPKLEKRLKATMERVKSLEVALKEAKEGAMKDRKRYQNEVERIKEAVRQRNLMRKGNVPNIVKPIRAGQHPSISTNMPTATQQKADEIKKETR